MVTLFVVSFLCPPFFIGFTYLVKIILHRNLYLKGGFVLFIQSMSILWRYIFQVAASFTEFESSGLMITFASFFQALAVILFFYSMWGRIRPIGSHIREAKGEEF